MFQLDNNPGRTTLVDEKEYLFFSGYAYLGIQHQEQFVQLVHEGMKQFGWLHPSSRISNTQLALFEEMEQQLSSITQTVATVCFQSGFGAGTVAASLFKGHPVFVCPEAHPAINKLQQQPLVFDKWAEQMLHHLHENEFITTPVLVTDAVNPLTGEVNDVDFLQYIEKPLIVVIDDSHGIGLLGGHGEGISALLPQKENIEYIITYSLSKALGINGGAISCTNKQRANYIKQLPGFTASTALSPALAYAFINGQNIYQQQRKKLQQSIAFMRTLVETNESISNDERLPIFILPEGLDEDYFEKKSIIISSFPYPTTNSKQMNRAVLNALHTANDLEQLSTAINAYTF